MRKINIKGFSLVELLVGVGLTSLLLVSVNLLFFSGIRGSRKSSAVNEVDSEGRYALGAMQQMIRYSRLIVSCSDNALTIRRVNGDLVTYSVDLTSGSEKISSTSANLTTQRVVVSGCSVPFFGCPVLGSTTEQIEVNICFRLQSRTALDVSDTAGESGSGFEYKTKVVLQNSGN
jgi:type II secretory pathway pseudopilin PulG